MNMEGNLVDDFIFDQVCSDLKLLFLLEYYFRVLVPYLLECFTLEMLRLQPVLPH